MKNDDVLSFVRRIMVMVQDLPSGIDEDADPEDTSPEDATAHIGGLIWQECNKFIVEIA